MTNTFENTDVYDTELTIDGKKFLVSFVCAFQRIVYTALDCSCSGEFNIRNGWVGDEAPDNSMLELEVTADILIKSILTHQ
jgi:hypothetical protein